MVWYDVPRSKWLTRHPPKPSPIAPCRSVYSKIPVFTLLLESDVAIADADVDTDDDDDAAVFVSFKYPIRIRIPSNVPHP